MNRLTKIIIAVLVCGLAGVTQAKSPKAGTGGIKGKIVGISGNGSIIIQTGKSSAGGTNQITIRTDANTTVEIDKVAGKHVRDLQAGERVIIQGDPAAGPVTDIQAKQSKHHGRRAL